MKKLTISITLLFFTISTLVMPYGNYDDVQSICAVYNHCLKQDADMDFLEFIGEKLLSFGLDPGEEDEAPAGKPHTPVNHNAIVQIQSGALYQVATVRLEEPASTICATNIPLANFPVPIQEFHEGVFHPPAAFAA